MTTSIRSSMRLGCLALALCSGLAGAAQAKCTIGKLLELPVTLQGTRPIVPLKLNGADVSFVVDSGAFYSTVDSATADQIKLPHEFAPFGARVQGIGGSTVPQIAHIAALDLAGVTLKNRTMIMTAAAGGGAQGLLGQDILGAFDVEYDLGHGAIRLMRTTDCDRSTSLAYWAGDRPVSVIDIDRPEREFVDHTIGSAVINGVRLRVIFDTGAQSSVLSTAAAARAGIKPGGEGVRPAGPLFGVGGRPIKTWVGRFASFKLGDEEMKNAPIRFGDIDLDKADMLLGSDFFLSHRVYVANRQFKLFLTYEGGPLFGEAIQALQRDTPDGATRPMALADASAEPAPTDADGFSRRGAVLVDKRDFDHALEDFTKAIELAPTEPRYLLERARLRASRRQPALAMADLDQALKLKPDLLPALILRAQLRLSERDPAGAAADVTAASQLAPPQADEHLMFGDLDRAATRFEAAVGEYDTWIKAHDADARMAAALFGRCRARAVLGQALDKALADCSRSLRLAPNMVSALETRGMVHLKSGAYDDAIKDCDAALAASPKQALALYVRGAAKLKKGQAEDGKADQQAALALQPNLAAQAKVLGLTAES